jgi:hypothetical protein
MAAGGRGSATMPATPAPEPGGIGRAFGGHVMAAEQSADEQGFYARDQLKEEMKKLAWANR